MRLRWISYLLLISVLAAIISGTGSQVSLARNSGAQRLVQRLEERGLEFSDVEKRAERKKETEKVANCPPPRPAHETEDPLTNALELRILLIDRLNNSIHMWSIKEITGEKEDAACH